jgi:hypothetical protein
MIRTPDPNLRVICYLGGWRRTGGAGRHSRIEELENENCQLKRQDLSGLKVTLKSTRLTRLLKPNQDGECKWPPTTP